MNSAMSAMGQSRQAKGLLLLGGLAGIVWVLSTWIITGSTQMLFMGGMVIALVMIIASTLNDWRTGFYLFIGWLLFEDLVRKYLGNGTALFFGKDLLAAITFFLFSELSSDARFPGFGRLFLSRYSCS